jgi:hypothetical protein
MTQCWTKQFPEKEEGVGRRRRGGGQHILLGDFKGT